MKSILLLSTSLLFIVNTAIAATTSKDEYDETGQLDALLRDDDDKFTAQETSTDAARREPVFHLRNDSVVYTLNADSGIKERFVFTAHDDDRLAAQLHFNYELAKAKNVFGYEVSYARKIGTLWYGLFGQSMSGTFQTMAENQTPNAGNSDKQAESRFYRGSSVTATDTLFGIGIGYRFRLIADSLDWDRFFETVNVYLTYDSFQDDFRSVTYTGYGFKADYGIHYRVHSSFFVGGKLSTHWAPVTRAKIDGDEASRDRTLMVSWTNIGLEFGYYF